ncbi:hypothetical protein C3Y98_05345 [Methylotenera oryzisoli]|uniref:DUF2116 family Zn-ribbon domain-containing protein n=1 Tax=Methylotenera oryzisoli TaxID=2080758 RepID=A0A4Y9VSM3_9PROT|nr:hypothetical protein C3Y98_05345 [Methylotenera oryzisoli]
MRVDDIATAFEETDRAEALKYRKPTVQPCGKCRNCWEPVGEQVLFCDADCRDDYDKRQKAKKHA